MSNALVHLESLPALASMSKSSESMKPFIEPGPRLEEAAAVIEPIAVPERPKRDPRFRVRHHDTHSCGDKPDGAASRPVACRLPDAMPVPALSSPRREQLSIKVV